MNHIPAEANGFHGAGRGRFDDEIGSIDELQEELGAARLVEVDRDAALGVVQGPPEQRPFGMRLVVVERRREARSAGVRRFELDHIGAELGEHASGQVAEFVSEVEHAEGRERSAGGCDGHGQSPRLRAHVTRGPVEPAR